MHAKPNRLLLISENETRPSINGVKRKSASDGECETSKRTSISRRSIAHQSTAVRHEEKNGTNIPVSKRNPSNGA